MEEHVSQSIIFENGIGHLPLTEGWGVYTTSVNATLVGPGNVYIRDVAGDGIDFETDSEDPNAEAYVYWVGSFPQVGDDDPDGQEYDVDFEVDFITKRAWVTWIAWIGFKFSITIVTIPFRLFVTSNGIKSCIQPIPGKACSLS